MQLKLLEIIPCAKFFSSPFSFTTTMLDNTNWNQEKYCYRIEVDKATSELCNCMQCYFIACYFSRRWLWSSKWKYLRITSRALWLHLWILGPLLETGRKTTRWQCAQGNKNALNCLNAAALPEDQIIQPWDSTLLTLVQLTGVGIGFQASFPI